jgi:CO/xanthine dehydrogenase FAD-binding subunit
MGTIGGNIGSALPSADLAPPLLVAGARVRLVSASAERELPLGEFLLGPGQTSRRPDELLAGITLDEPPPRGGETYVKSTARGAMEFAIVGVAARISLAEDRTIESARIAVCAAGPTPFRAHDSEQALLGTRGTESALAEAAALAVGQSRPIDDARSSAGYRRRMVGELVRRAVATSVDRASRGEGGASWS